MLGNGYINKINARHFLYMHIMIRLYCREGLSHPVNFFVVSKGTQGATSNWFLYITM